MQISKFTLKNYKTFAKEVNFQVRPITLFFGYNSAGKSAALRFLKLLADSTGGDNFSPINLSSDSVRGSDFIGLLSKYTSSPRFKFSITFADVRLGYVINYNFNKNTQYIEKLKINFDHDHDPEPVTFAWIPNYEDSDAAVNSYALSHGDKEMPNAHLEFDGLVPTKYPINLAQYLERPAERLREYSRNFTALSSDCIVPGRYQTETTPLKKISHKGEGIIPMLQVADEEVINDISKWYEKATGYSFKRSAIPIGNRKGHRFTLHPYKETEIDVDIVDTGEGMGQVLPVVSLLTLAQHDVLEGQPVISLEHPELHIHPDAHAYLAELFCQVITSNPSCRILVETHSENLLLGLQLAITEGRIKPSDVAVHWVRGTQIGAAVDFVTFDELARPSENNWPVDVYRKNSKLARDIFEKREHSGK